MSDASSPFAEIKTDVGSVLRKFQDFQVEIKTLLNKAKGVLHTEGWSSSAKTHLEELRRVSALLEVLVGGEDLPKDDEIVLVSLVGTVEAAHHELLKFAAKFGISKDKKQRKR